jgi:hypothetical protein
MAEDLVDLYLEAIGGREAVRQLSSMRVEGTVSVSGKDVGFQLWAQAPDSVRIETMLPGAGLAVQGYDGETAWQQHPEVNKGGPRPLRGPAGRDFISQAAFTSALVNAAERGHRLRYAGLGYFGGRPAYEIAVTERSGLTYSLFLDSETFLLSGRLEMKTFAGRPIRVETAYLDYQPAERVLMPRRIDVREDGQLMRSTRIRKLEANVEVSAELFRMPLGFEGPVLGF